MQTRKLKLATADKFYSFDLGPFDYFRLVNASGFVTIAFGDGAGGELEGISKKDNFMFPTTIPRGRIRIKSTVAETITVFHSVGTVWKGDTSLDNVTLVYADLAAGNYDLNFEDFGAFCGILVYRVSTFLGTEIYGQVGAGVLSNRLPSRMLKHNTKATTSFTGNGYSTGCPALANMSAAVIQYVETYGFQKLRLLTTAEQTLYINIVRIPPTWPTSGELYMSNAVPATNDSFLSDWKNFSFQVTGVDGSNVPTVPTSWIAILEGSNDDLTYTTILRHDNAANTNGQTVFTTTPFPVRFWRTRLEAVVLGGAASVILHAVGTH